MLPTLALVVTLVVVVAHIGFMVLETFLWTTPTGLKVFRLTPEDAEKTKLLAQNQGVYNGVLGAALAFAVLTHETTTTLVLLTFVVIVGVYGGVTVKRSILVLQALPALVAIALTYLAR